IIKNFLAADFILSPNSFTTEKMLRDSYRLDGIFRGKIAEVGYPRVDAQFVGSLGTTRAVKQLREHGIRVPDSTKIKLYAHTGKRASKHHPPDEMQEESQLIDELQQKPETAWRDLLKHHHHLDDQDNQYPEIKHRLIPNQVPANR